MTLAEHVQWARRRAHEYVDRGAIHDAVSSMLSDLRKHEEIPGAAVACCGFVSLALVKDAGSARKWIDDCLPSVPVEPRVSKLARAC